MRRETDFLIDMVQACRNILEWTAGMDLRAFHTDHPIQAAILHEFMILGEASKRLSPAFKAEHPELAWKEVSGMRDRLIHGYFNVDLTLVWDAVCQDIPDLLAVLNRVLPPLSE